MSKEQIEAMADEKVTFTRKDIMAMKEKNPRSFLAEILLGRLNTSKITGIDYYTYHKTETGAKVFATVME